MDGGGDKVSDIKTESKGLTKLEGLAQALIDYGAKYTSCELEALPSGKTRLRLRDGLCDAFIKTERATSGRINVEVDIVLTSSPTDRAFGMDRHIFSFDGKDLRAMASIAASVFSMYEERQPRIIENELSNKIVEVFAKDKKSISIDTGPLDRDHVIVRSGAWATGISVTVDEIGAEVRFDVSRDGQRGEYDATNEVLPLTRKNGVLGKANLFELFTRAQLHSDKPRTYLFGKRLDDVNDILAVAADIKEILVFMEENLGGGREKQVHESIADPSIRDLIREAHAGQPVRNFFQRN